MAGNNSNEQRMPSEDLMRGRFDGRVHSDVSYLRDFQGDGKKKTTQGVFSSIGRTALAEEKPGP